MKGPFWTAHKHQGGGPTAREAPGRTREAGKDRLDTREAGKDHLDNLGGTRGAPVSRDCRRWPAQHLETAEEAAACVVAAGGPALSAGVRLSPQCLETAEGAAARVVAAGDSSLRSSGRSLCLRVEMPSCTFSVFWTTVTGQSQSNRLLCLAQERDSQKSHTLPCFHMVAERVRGRRLQRCWSNKVTSTY